jgi:hypothetical protein
MLTQSDNKGQHGFANNMWTQIGLLTVVAVVLIVLAALYVW